MILVFIALVYVGPPWGSAAEVGDYTIGIEDVLSVAILEQPELNSTATVGPDGTIVLPQPIGAIRAEGLTRTQVQEAIRRQLSSYIKTGVSVTVQVTQYNSRKISIFGDGIRSPGTFTYAKVPTFLEVLAMAGGLTATADRRNIRILPADEQTPTETIDLERLFQEERPSWPKLTPGDTIFVPAKPLAAPLPSAVSQPESPIETSVPQTVPQKEGKIIIHVLGQVNQRGSYTFDTPPSLPHVLAQAGDALQPDLLEQVQITREDGMSLTVNMKEYITTGKQLPRLQSGDLVYIPEADTSAQKNATVLGAVNLPGRYPIDGRMSLIDLLATANGVTADADVTKIQITRETADFVETRTVNLQETAPQIQPGDRIWVPQSKQTDIIGTTFEILRTGLLLFTAGRVIF